MTTLLRHPSAFPQLVSLIISTICFHAWLTNSLTIYTYIMVELYLICDTYTQIQLNKLDMLFHHIIGLIFGAFAIYYYNELTDEFRYYLVSMEISTVFMASSKLVNIFQKTNTDIDNTVRYILGFINKIFWAIFIITFFFFRLINSAIISLSPSTYELIGGLCNHNIKCSLLWFVLYFLFYGLNVFWFYQIIVFTRKQFLGDKKK